LARMPFFGLSFFPRRDTRRKCVSVVSCDYDAESLRRYPSFSFFFFLLRIDISVLRLALRFDSPSSVWIAWVDDYLHSCPLALLPSFVPFLLLVALSVQVRYIMRRCLSLLLPLFPPLRSPDIRDKSEGRRNRRGHPSLFPFFPFSFLFSRCSIFSSSSSHDFLSPVLFFSPLPFS